LAALEDFRTKLAADAVRERAVDHTVGPNEQSAIRVLAAAQAMPNISAREKALFLAAQHAVKLAKFQDLPRKLNAFQKAVNKKPVTTAAYLDKLLEIIRTYPLDVNEPDSPAPETPAVDPKQLPQIILSESFSAK
jgi:hypothetical protein